ncbi:type VI secretion system-associated protein TagF [Paraburkholderia sp. LEh10]|uniref:type VI secretion system-associated protein TagF n=1 Tax=Paraburkholderia sp. LEh10 TaxID=2821353 RepID=UPI001AE4222D|nr:type VI secretion system-associated protein TagF [Paraburkholderia sp. LEh10]MBP0590319.1 type VI secretion system-associated protein TagF [Paraburkholderia sp. LEh10]
MNGGVGFFGKLPRAGDFVQRRLPATFVESWDRHFQRAVEAGRRELGAQWDAAWRQGPAWRFVLPAPVCGGVAWCGLVGPAVDRLGRAFPIVLAARCDADVEAVVGNHAWFDALERVYRSAQNEFVSVETFDARVATLPGPLTHMQRATPRAALWRSLPWDDGQWQLAMPEGAAVAMMLAEAWSQLGRRPGPWCLWWTAGAARLLATRGLPLSYAVLLEPVASDADVAGEVDGTGDVLHEFGLRSVRQCEPVALPDDDAMDAAQSGLQAHERHDERSMPTQSHGLHDPLAVDDLALAAAAMGDRWVAASDGASVSSMDTTYHAFAHRSQIVGDGRDDRWVPGRAWAAGHAAHAGEALLLLDEGRTLLLSADEGPYHSHRHAAHAIRETAQRGAADLASLRTHLLTLHARLREGQPGAHDACHAPTENGAALIARFDAARVRLLRIGAASAWHWRCGQLQPLFVERAAGAGGEFDDLLFGDAWLTMPGIGGAQEPDCDEACVTLEDGDRLLLVVTRALTQLPHACLAEALALATNEEVRLHLAVCAGLGAQPAQWPLAVLGARS